MEFVYIYEELPDDLSTNGSVLTDWKDLPEITRVLNDKFSFYGNYSLDGQNADLIQNGHFIKAKTENGTWQYFEIYEPKKTLDSISFNGRFIGAMANRNFIDYSFTDNGNGSQIMANLHSSLAFRQKFRYLSDVPTTHQFTAKQVGPIDAIVGSNNGNQNLVGVTGGEFDVDNYDIKLVKQIGADNGYRIDFGINLESIESEVSEQTVNSLFLVGGVPDNDYDEDKEPLSYKFLEIEGVDDSNRRIGKRENSNCKTLEELKEWGQSLFDKDRIHEPSATHKVNMVALEHTLEYQELYDQFAKLHFGDVAHVYVDKLKMDVKERMVEYVWFPTIGKYKSIVLGSNLSKYTSKAQTETQKLADKINNRTETLVQNILNATAWITGNSGGHVVFRPEKAPSEILIMDTNKVATSKRVWRWNLNGLGYSSNGVNGPFDVAITSKGEIVANFIKVGIIQADVFEGSFNAYGDQLKLVAGALQAVNDGKKLMELTKNGMEFWGKDGKNIGVMGIVTKENNPLEGFAITDPYNNMLVRTYNKDIILATNVGKGMFLGRNGKVIVYDGGIDSYPGDNGEAGNFYGNVLVSKDLNVKGKLTINGQQVYPGQGGGPGPGDNPGGNWNGQYPPEVTSSADKFAWELWIILLAKGYSKAAAAGILGNVQGEAGPSMNPDIAQIGGPAYGIVQWDGSAYPLVGPPTYDGRTYVQNLMRAAGITEDYKTMSAQGKLLDWSMFNGQWIGRVAPTTQAGYKAISDPSQAATAFEANFERPANTHPDRQGYAVTWYNKFKDLQITQANGDIVSIARGWLNWFYYVQLHPSSDLGDLNNPNRSGGTDCSGFVWLVLNKAGYRVPGNMQWYTGSMTSDARGAHSWLQEITPEQSRAGDVIIYNVGGGAGNNGHTAILLEAYHGNDTQIIEMGGDSRYPGVNISTMGYAFGSLLGGDRCIARALK
ncbi:phage tail tip lysozyme [Enterococcus pseudoavium]|uniref:Phage tail tip lysozyme n=1 Tax=Enterococcus pseudoavium TaxID=44007 RepID=A0AAE4I4Y7_9ENTE|nr:phage tail tip lysozyme [Enterococcus pseudoavium]MDT2737696.1 phage tail tip lysozyme [Enterococcus pseudoavium]